MLGSAFLLGLAGSLHCILMCGPLVLLLGSSKKSSMLWYHIIYHSGRISTYGLLGIFAGLVGKGFTIAGGHQILAIALGSLIILIGLSQFLHQYGLLIKMPHLDTLSYWLIKKNSQLKTQSAFIKGMLNGLLPCGLIYVALAAAIVSHSLLDGLYYMLFFGLGTTPILFCIIIFGSVSQRIRRLPIQNILPLITIIFGLWILIRGLGIGIPFWSPDVTQLNITNENHCHH